VQISVSLSKPIITSAWVFNAEQVTGMPVLQQKINKPGWGPEERTEKLVERSGASVTHRKGNQAFYDPVADQITLPDRQQFDSAGKYYATLLHEMGHWTGHTSRLDRSVLNKFGTQAYAREELRAEIASLLMGRELKIGHDPSQHTAYVEDWISVLQDSPFEIHAAAADAEKIFNYLLAFEQSRMQSANHAKQDGLAQTHPAGRAKYLFINDTISYIDTVYKVQGHLKQGRLRMQDLSTGRSFILAKSDGLYDSLLHAKQEQDAGKTIPDFRTLDEPRGYNHIRR
jgi:hypothetical protein